MRKLFTVVLVLSMLMPAAALADLPDISGLTQEELIELNRMIQVRLFDEKLAEGVTIHPGVYTVGEDLPAGVYRAEAIIPEEAYVMGSALVFNPDDRFMDVSGSVIGNGYENIGKIVMEDGQIFEVSIYSIRLFPYAGLFN